jgi:hypothetical protein
MTAEAVADGTSEAAESGSAQAFGLSPSMVLADSVVAPLNEVLEEARRWGFLGPGPIDEHVKHSLSLALLCPPLSGRNLDLGSGGGVPGLVLAAGAPQSRWILVDAQRRRTAFLVDAVIRLGFEERIEVRCQRAEEVGRGLVRATIDVVVARSFGTPANTAECAAPLLRLGGSLVVAEPPGAPDRWSSSGLGQLGLEEAAVLSTPIAARRFVLRTACPERYPRRNGLPRKRPLF